MGRPSTRRASQVSQSTARGSQIKIPNDFDWFSAFNELIFALDVASVLHQIPVLPVMSDGPAHTLLNFSHRPMMLDSNTKH